jgi:2-phosphosulfolactate phosphatase
MPEHELRVHNLPRYVSERDLADRVVVVIDLLRASSTICQALASGATEVVPFLQVDDAIAAAEKAGRASVVLGGERKGGRIAGFDVGNSPSEYTPAVVAGRSVFITTTNGTRALHHARLARRILVGSFLNFSSVVASIQNEDRVDIICAGTDREETREDILAAGAMISRLMQLEGGAWTVNSSAAAARDEWEAIVARAATTGRPLNEQIALELQDTQGGRNLLGIDLNRDLVDCAQIDQLNVVPELDVQSWRITARAHLKPLR